jgi:signal transduction histidine kinase
MSASATPEGSQRAADRDGVQRALARLYDRLGPRILLVCIGGALLFAVITGLAAFLIGFRYLRLSMSDALDAFAGGMPVMAAGALAGLRARWPLVRTPLSWSPQAKLEQTILAWDALTRGSRVVIRACVVGAAVTAVPVITAVIVIFDLPSYSAAVLAVAGSAALAAAWVLVTFGTELVTRPLVEDLAGHLPEDFDPGGQAGRLQTKALAPLPVVAMFTAIVTGGFTDLASPGTPRLALALGIAIASTAVAGVVFVLIMRSVLDPVDELMAGTRRVRAGDLETPVPVVTADDLGQLAHSFNQMLVGLREREALREHNAALIDDLRESRARIVAVADAERRRVERDLHDGAQQHLVLLNLKLGLVQRLVKDDPKATALIAELRADLDHALRELRDLAHGIYPALLENEGLPGALGEAVERGAIRASLDTDGVGRYRREIEAAVYFCCLEALQNAAKHAGDGARVTVRLVQRGGALTFQVADDGRGFEPGANGASTGLHNMIDRIGALGGELVVESAPGRGTRVSGTIPLGER